MSQKHTSASNGFTLVEISIVMIIVGLLIGGTFGGMKLIENMELQKTMRDMKAIETAALTFKDTFGRLPGDFANPAARLPNCTVAPCATGGNGNRVLQTATPGVLVDTDEMFTFWHHLQAANLLDMAYHNTTDMEFGEGAPAGPKDFGYRLGWQTGMAAGCNYIENAHILLTKVSSATQSYGLGLQCGFIKQIDEKFDDGFVLRGNIMGVNACDCCGCNSTYNVSGVGTGYAIYNAKF